MARTVKAKWHSPSNKLGWSKRALSSGADNKSKACHILGHQFNESLRLCEVATELARACKSPHYIGAFRWTSGEAYRRLGDPQGTVVPADGN